MKFFLSLHRHLLVAIGGCLLLCACGQTARAPQELTSKIVDLSGSWEMDYSQSDNVQAKLNSLVRELRRQMERQQKLSQQGATGGVSMGGYGANSGESIVGLARMAEMITGSSLLEIEQDENSIKVKREENFALACEFYPGQFHTEVTPLGSEICGWDDHQLVFKILLPEGLRIQHILTMGPEGERLGIATTVVSDQVSFPFTVNRVYNRFDPENNGIRCEMTLTRGRVCTTEAR